MLENGADPNLKDMNKCSSLHVVCWIGLLEVIPEFAKLEKLDLKSKDSKGKMAYQYIVDLDENLALAITPESLD